MKVEVKHHVYLGRYVFQDPEILLVCTYDPRGDEDFLFYEERDITVTATVPPEAALKQQLIGRLREKQQKVRAKAQKEVEELDERIQSLMAITHEEN